MKPQALIVLSSVLLGAVVAGPCYSASPTIPQGLVAVQSRDFDELYLLPGTGLAGYRRVLIDPALVEFSKDWLTQSHAYNRSAPHRVDPDEARRIASETAASLESLLAEAFKARGYEIVTAMQPGVLRLSPSVAELYVNAPDRPSPWTTKTFTQDAGQATLRLEARDAASGALLARVVHRATARQVGRLNLANEVSNRFWFDTLFSRWAANCAAEFEVRR